jgi:hypothetical protein
LFHGARCDSSDGSSSSSTGHIPELVESKIVDSSDDESGQASSSTFGSAYRAECFVEYMFVPMRKKTNEDTSVKSEVSDSSSTVMPPIKRLKLEDDGSVDSNQDLSSNSSYDSDSTLPPPHQIKSNLID